MILGVVDGVPYDGRMRYPEIGELKNILESASIKCPAKRGCVVLNNG